ncbi:pre-mRNA processing RNA-helicase, partial [Ascosphaera atra]
MRPASALSEPELMRNPMKKPASPAPAAALTDEQKKAERLAKLEAWKKKKQAAEQEKKQKEAEAQNVAKETPPEVEKKAPAATQASSTTTSSTATITTTTTTTAAVSDAQPAKFDPKVIANKAAAPAKAAPAPLGADVAPPKAATNGKAQAPPSTAAASTSIALKAGGNVSGFGLGGKANADADKLPAKRALDFGDEESTKKRLAKLPEPALEDAAKVPVDEGDQDDETNMQDGGTEEEMAAAARAAAERREERLQDDAAGKGGEDVEM